MKQQLLFAFLICAVVLNHSVNAEKGVDNTRNMHYIEENSWKCLKSNGYEFALLNVFHRNNTNKYFAQNYKMAEKYFSHIDVTATLCGMNKAEKNRVQKIRRDLGRHFSARVFLEVSPLDGCWGTNTTYNLLYVEAVARGLHKYGFHLGIFTNESNWKTIMGNTSVKTSLSSLPLWYASNDSLAEFDNLKEAHFAGWRVPELKQYKRHVKACGAKVNFDYANGAPIHRPPNDTKPHPHHHVEKHKKGEKHHGHGHSLKSEKSEKEKEQKEKSKVTVSVSKGSKEDSTELSNSISIASESTRFNSFSSSCVDSTCYYTTTTYDSASSEPTDDESLGSDTYDYPSDYEGPTEGGKYDHEVTFSGLSKTAFQDDYGEDIDENADAAEIADNDAVDAFDAVASAADDVLDVIGDILLGFLAIF